MRTPVVPAPPAPASGSASSAARCAREYGGETPASAGAWPGAQFAAERGDAFGEADQAEAAATGRGRQRRAALVILALPGEAVTPPQAASFELLLCFVVGATVFAGIWSRFFRRGPLEYLLNSAPQLANRVR